MPTSPSTRAPRPRRRAPAGRVAWGGGVLFLVAAVTARHPAPLVIALATLAVVVILAAGVFSWCAVKDRDPGKAGDLLADLVRDLLRR